MKPILGMTVEDARSLSDEKDLSERLKVEDNLLKLTEYIKNKINKEAKKGKYYFIDSFPLDPEKNECNNQFLITTRKRNFAIIYDSEIIEIVEKEGFSVEDLGTYSDGMSGVKFNKIKISWE